MALGDSVTAKQRETYLAELREGASHKKAAAAAGPSLRTFGNLRVSDEDFAVLVIAAYREGNQVYLQRMQAIALGEHTASTVEQRALYCICAARMPEMFRFRDKLEVSGPEGGPVRQKVEVSQSDAADAFAALAAAGLLEPGRVASADAEGEPVQGS